MKSVLDLIEEGHWEKSVGPLGRDKNKKQVCRKDEEDWPCSAIRAARVTRRTTGSSKT